MSEWNDLISNWSFNATDSDGNEFSPASFTKGVSQSVDEAYELTTVTINFGNANVPYHQQVFSANFSFDVNCETNQIEVAVSSDDTASVTAGGVTASSTLYHPGTASSTWSATPMDPVHVTGTYNNIGGPYNLNVTITLKKLRELYFQAEKNTPDELAEAATKPENEKEAYLTECRSTRTTFGCGELVHLKLSNFGSGESLLGTATSYSVTGSTDGISTQDGEYILNTRKTSNTTISVTVTFQDGHVFSKSAEIKIPTGEIGQKISYEEYHRLTGDGEYEPTAQFYTSDYYKITVTPTNVSFSGLYHWELAGTDDPLGLFLWFFGIDTKHHPGKPYQLGDNNDCYDKVGFSVGLNEEQLSQCSNSLEGGYAGILVWTIPVRWSITNPEEEDEDNENDEDNEDNEKDESNDKLPYDGALPDRVQTTTAKLTDDKTCLKIGITKTF